MKFRIIDSTAKRLIGFYFGVDRIPNIGDTILLKKEDKKYKYFKVDIFKKQGKNFRFINSNITIICNRIT